MPDLVAETKCKKDQFLCLTSIIEFGNQCGPLESIVS